MLSKTTETAIMALLYLTMRPQPRPASPRQVAEALGVSASYLAKIFTRLAKAGILQAHRGVQGGVTLRRGPAEISLLEIVDACQGPLVDGVAHPARVGQCDFHEAVTGFEQSMVASLSDWTLARLAAHPCPAGDEHAALDCRVSSICPKRKQSRARGGGGRAL
jgi:Rrf2 family protein